MGRQQTIWVATFIIILASCLRLYGLGWNPAWYTDEGTHIEIARHLMVGENYYLGITESYLVAARLPLFEYALATWFQFVGTGMLQLRILTAFTGILVCALTYQLTYRICGRKEIALLAILLLAIYPKALIYCRFGFSYNLLALLNISGLYCLLHVKNSHHRRTVIICAFLLGLGLITDFIAWSFVPVWTGMIIIFSRRHTPLFIIVIFLPLLIFVLSELLWHPEIFIHDMTYTLSRVGNLSFELQIQNVFKNILILSTESWWFPIGFIGLLVYHSKHKRIILLSVICIPILISGRTVALYDLSAYYMIPFLPFVPVGIAFFIQHIERREFIKPNILKSIVLAIIGISLLSTLSSLQTGFRLGIEHFLISKSEATAISDFMTDYAKKETHIIVSPSLAWMLNSQVTDFQITGLTHGNAIHFPASLYPSRLAFPIHYTNADFAIVDNLWRDWGAVHISYVAHMLQEVEKWDLLFQTDTIQVYQNPQA